MEKLFCILIFILVFNYPAAPQDSTLHLAKTYPADIVDITVDNLDNIYILTGTDQLKKLDANGDSLAIYNNIKKYGKLSLIDVTNPLKVLLLYKDFATIVVLDRLLAIRGTIDLRRHDILQASAAGLSYDNNIWLFDEYTSKLKKIDDEGNTLVETPDFRMLFPVAVTPQQIFDQNKMVYLYDSAKGLFVFDYYGTFKKKIPLLNWKGIKVVDNIVMGITGSIFNTYNLQTFTQHQQQIPLSFKNTSRFIFSNGKLFTVTNNRLSIYTYKPQ